MAWGADWKEKVGRALMGLWATISVEQVEVILTALGDRPPASVLKALKRMFESQDKPAAPSVPAILQAMNEVGGFSGIQAMQRELEALDKLHEGVVVELRGKIWEVHPRGLSRREGGRDYSVPVGDLKDVELRRCVEAARSAVRFSEQSPVEKFTAVEAAGISEMWEELEKDADPTRKVWLERMRELMRTGITPLRALQGRNWLPPPGKPGEFHGEKRVGGNTEHLRAFESELPKLSARELEERYAADRRLLETLELKEKKSKADKSTLKHFASQRKVESWMQEEEERIRREENS